MFKGVTKYVCLLAMALAITGCKIEVIVSSGGDVKSESSTRDCVGGSLCEHNVTDLTFNETFTAVARPGYVFTGWNEGHGFLCGDSVDPVCKVSLVGIPDGDAAITAMLASGHIFYVMPHFQFVGIDTDGDGIADHLDEDDDNDGVFDKDDKCPLNQTPVCAPDSITANGRVWAQPDQFLNLSIDDILAVCPVIPGAGIGVCSGTLNGYDMTGWAWAYFQEVSELFNSYGVSPPLDGLDSRTLVNSSWAPAFFNGGWRPTVAYSDDYQWAVLVYFLDVITGGTVNPLVARMYSRFGALEMTQPDIVGVWRSESLASPNVGALFVRLP